MRQAVPWLAGLVTVVVALGVVLTWLSHHVPLGVIGLVVTFGIGIGSGTAGALAVLQRVLGRLGVEMPPDMPRLQIDWPSYVVYWVGIVAAFALTAVPSHSEDGRRAVAYGLAASLLIPVGWQLYLIERRSLKTCPDCAEDVKRKANVCRYCGHRWRDLPQPETEATPTT